MMTWTSMLIAGIRGYQRFVSALLPPACRFYPSCSEYAVQAIATYGPLRGLLKAGWRLLRCHPLSRGGVDLPTVTPGGSWSSHSRPGASRPGASRPSHSR